MTARATILPHAHAEAMKARSAEAAELNEALSRAWPTDAHFLAYEPRTVAIAGTDRRDVVRLLQHAADDRPAVYDVLHALDVPDVRVVVLVGDIDGPGHGATPEWRAEQEPRLEASGLAYYETRGGYRVLAQLAEPFVITTREHAEAWSRQYLEWCAYLEAEHGLVLDRACKDWTRLFRLPNVVRDGAPQRAAVRGAWVTFDPAAHVRPVANTASAPRGAARGASADDAALAKAHAIAERMPPSVSGHGGDRALFDVARELATVLNDAAAIESVLVGAFNPRCVPPWDATKLKREAENAAKRHAEKAPEKEWASRARATLESKPAADDPAGTAPLILQSRRDAAHVLVYDGPERGHQPVAMGALRLRLTELGRAPMLSDGKRPLAPPTICERYGRTFGEAVYDFAAPVSSYDEAHDRVVVGYPMAAVAARYDADVHAWLGALAGPARASLETWIASCAQGNISRVAAALVLLGPADVGKTLLACALAQMWGAEQPPEASLLVKQFNGDLARCPIVFDDEAELFGSREMSTKRFRQVTQSTGRNVERKGREVFALRGAMRLVVAANEVSDLRFSDVTGPEVVRAVSDRLCVIDAQPREAACKAALARLRVAGSYRCDIDRIVAHFVWLAENTPMRLERFAGATGGESVVLVGHVAGAPEVWDTLRLWIETGRGAAWSAQEGDLCAEPRLIASPGVELVHVHRALAPFRMRTARPWRSGESARPRLWVINALTVADALGLDDAEVNALVGRLAQ